MVAAYISLLVLVGLTPLLMFFDLLLLDAVVELYAATAMMLVAFSLRAGEAKHWIGTVRWAVLLALFPIAWIVIQMLPLPIGGLSGSIWQSAATGLGTKVWSSITIDPGLTLVALIQYVSLIAIGAIAAATSVSRQQAERLFIVLNACTVVLSLAWIVLYFVGFQGSEFDSVRAAAAVGSSLGVVLSAAMIVLIVEHHLTRRSQQDFRWDFLTPLLGASLSLLVCALVAAVAGSEQAIFAAGCGVTAILLIQLVRRVGLGWRSAVVTAGVAIVAGAVIVSTKATPAPANFLVRYAAHSTADLISATDRMVGATGLVGSGAGTFDAIFHIFASGENAGVETRPPTFAAQIAIEFGQPALWIMVASAIALIVMCAKGGFHRGRDFYYPLVGAAVGITALIMAFCNSGLNNIAVAIVLVSTSGLALAQSTSRSR